MSASKREQILTALESLIDGTVSAQVERNRSIPTSVPDAGLCILRDGEPGEPEVTLSPLTYSYEHMAELEVYIQKAAAAEAAFDAISRAIGLAIEADRTLGGLCNWVEAMAPTFNDLAEYGAVNIKAGLIEIQLTYDTTSPLT